MSIENFEALEGFGEGGGEEAQGAPGAYAILFPGTLSFKRKQDEAMYIVALLARELAPTHAKFTPEETFDFV